MLDFLARWAPELTPAKPRRAFVIASWLITVMGVGFYLVNFLGGKTLWLDEAMLALNLRHLSWAELAGKLDYNQLAPIGWLYLQKALYDQTGNLEYGLRVTSFAAAAGALVIFRSLAFRVLDDVGALSAVLLYALLGAIVRYAAEVKPYTVDLFLAVAAMAAAAALMRQHGRWAWIAFAAIGLVTVLFSFAAVYVLAGCAAAVFLFMLGHRRFRDVAAVVGIAVVWLAVFLALFLKVYRPQLGGSELVEGGSHNFFVRTSYAPFPPTSLGDLLWYPQWGEGFLEFLFHPQALAGAAVLIGLGAYAIIRRSLPLFLIAFAPLAIGLVASSLQLYPLYHRLILFLTPGLFLAMGAAADWLVARARGAVAPAAVAVLIVAMGSAPYILGNLKSRPPFALQDVRPLLAELHRQVRPGDTVYIGNLGLPAYLLYRDQYGLAKTPWRAGYLIERSWSCYFQDLGAAAKPGRSWFLVVSNVEETMEDDDAFSAVLAAHGLQGEKVMQAQSATSRLIRVDLRPGPPPAHPPAPQTCGEGKADNRFHIPARLRAREMQATGGV